MTSKKRLTRPRTMAAIMSKVSSSSCPRVVILEQLGDVEKELYFQFLLENDVQFTKVEDDCYVANVHADSKRQRRSKRLRPRRRKC